MVGGQDERIRKIDVGGKTEQTCKKSVRGSPGKTTTIDNGPLLALEPYKYKYFQEALK